MLNLKQLPNCQPDEKIAFLLRRHPVTLAGLVFSYLAILAIPIFAFWYLRAFQPEIVSHSFWQPVLMLCGSILFLFIWLFLFHSWMDYHLDVWVVTSARIMNIKQTGLFSRRVSELRLYRVQDVTASVTGALHTLFDYGDIEIQSAGEHDNFFVGNIPHPNNVTKTILELAEIDRQRHLADAVEEFGSPQPPEKKNSR
ncbi:MAG: PH domain-containing protein [bacterium]|nr:PH domain-containing protein [bacterium]